MKELLELLLSMVVCFGLSGVYVVYTLNAAPAGGHPFGHWLGIVGTLLMVSTEILYSARKRIRWLKWAGPLRWWLSAHILTGIVGPFMVLMHTAFQFRGLAGLTMGLTALVVASGFLGRYFYTAIPRSMAGAEASAEDLTAQIKRAQEEIAGLSARRSAAVRALIEADANRKRKQRGDLMLVLARSWDEWQYRRRLHSQVRRLEKIEKQKLSDVEAMLARRRNLERQVRTLEAARRLLSLWHIAHVPMGLALFGSAAIHAGAALYFGSGIWPLSP